MRTKLFAVFLFAASLLMATSASAAVTCPVITKTLKFGSHSAEVTQLQTYLAQYPALYPEAVVSGYFGRATEKAVQRFQTAQKIVSSGTPATTGYGAVGTRTRSALLACTNITGLSASSTPAVATSSPTMPQSPAVTVETTVAAKTGTESLFFGGATTTITYGEGKVPNIVSFKLEPDTVLITGEKTFAAWNVQNAMKCDMQQLNQSSGSYSTLMENVGLSGQMFLTATEDPSVFSIRCDAMTDSTSTPTQVRRDLVTKIVHHKPTCEIKTDAESYVYGSTGKVSWTSTGADSAEFVQLEGDYVPMPYGSFRTEGFAIVSMVSGSSQKVQMNVKGKGGTGTCSKTFTITAIPSLY